MRLSIPQQHLTVQGPAGAIEARLSAPEEPRWAAVIAHPHPLYGGSLDNRVVEETAHCLLQQGTAVLRFNFRGVGGSEGKHDGGVGERLDLEAAVAEVKRRFPGRPCLVAGYSFGSYVALSWASSGPPNPPPVDRLLALAPPVNTYDFSFMETATVPVAVLCGAVDSLTPQTTTRAKLGSWPSVVHLDFLSGAGHDLGSAGPGVESLRGALRNAVHSLHTAG